MCPSDITSAVGPQHPEAGLLGAPWGEHGPAAPHRPGTLLAWWGLSTKGKGNMSMLCQWQRDLAIRDRDECMAPGVRPRLPGAGVGVVSSTFFLYAWELSARLGGPEAQLLGSKIQPRCVRWQRWGPGAGEPKAVAASTSRWGRWASGRVGAWAGAGSAPGAGSAVHGPAFQEAALGIPESLPKSRIPLLHVCSHGLYCLVFLNIG